MIPTPDLQALFDACPYPYILFAPDLRIIGANAAYLRVTGSKAEDIVGRNAFEAFPPNPLAPDTTDAEAVRASVQRAIATRRPHSTELLRYALARPTEQGPVYEERCWTVLHTPVLDGQGEVAFVAQNAIDVTEALARGGGDAPLDGLDAYNRAQMHQALLRSRDDETSQLRSLFRQAPGFMAVLMGPRYVVEIANAAYDELVGNREIRGRPLFEALPELGGQGFEDLLDRVRASGQPYVGRGEAVQVRRGEGAEPVTCHVDFVYQPIFNPAGEVERIFVQGHDVTEAYLAQAEKRLAEERLQSGLDGARMAVWDWDLVTGKIRYSDNAAAVFGCRWEDIDGVLKCVHPDDVELMNEAVSKALAERSGYDMVHRLVRPDSGELVWMNSRGTVLCGEDGAPRGIRGASVDVTALKQAQAELARVNGELAARVARLAEVERRQGFQLEVADLLRRLDRPDQIFKQVNRLLGRHLGVARVLCGDLDFDSQAVTAHSNYVDCATLPIEGSFPIGRFGMDGFPRFESGKAWVCGDMANDGRATAAIRAAFAAFRIRAAVAVPLGRPGSPACCLLVGHDVPRSWSGEEIRLVEEIAERMWVAVERARAEDALREADVRKDEFLAMLAHELRNPLAPISAAADLLRLGRLDAGGIARTSQVISRQVGHMTGLVDDLMDVSRVTRGLVELERKCVDVRRVVADAVEQVRPLVEGRRHQLSVGGAPGHACVLGDHKRLVQVLANLLANAAKYTPEGGAIRVELRGSGDELVLAVADNGIGIGADLLPRVFDLFAQAQRTPDRSQGGLGLGLALVKSLLELHGGSVSAHSKGPGHGSEFVVRLPRLQADAGTRHDDEDGLPLARRASRLRVMVVDDNVDAADMLKPLLECSGFDVTVAHRAEDGLALARAQAFDAFLLDIGLPGIDGREMARKLRACAMNGSATLVAVSGYGQQGDRASALESGFDHYFVKPLETARLLAVLEQAEPARGAQAA